MGVDCDQWRNIDSIDLSQNSKACSWFVGYFLLICNSFWHLFLMIYRGACFRQLNKYVSFWKGPRFSETLFDLPPTHLVCLQTSIQPGGGLMFQESATSWPFVPPTPHCHQNPLPAFVLWKGPGVEGRSQVEREGSIPTHWYSTGTDPVSTDVENTLAFGPSALALISMSVQTKSEPTMDVYIWFSFGLVRTGFDLAPNVDIYDWFRSNFEQHRTV